MAQFWDIPVISFDADLLLLDGSTATTNLVTVNPGPSKLMAAFLPLSYVKGWSSVAVFVTLDLDW
eukprot:scaffold5619_cov134-Pinguiococcus_pyrenoidosus.AAC.1